MAATAAKLGGVPHAASVYDRAAVVVSPVPEESTTSRYEFTVLSKVAPGSLDNDEFQIEILVNGQNYTGFPAFELEIERAGHIPASLSTIYAEPKTTIEVVRRNRSDGKVFVIGSGKLSKTDQKVTKLQFVISVAKDAPDGSGLALHIV